MTAASAFAKSTFIWLLFALPIAAAETGGKAPGRLDSGVTGRDVLTVIDEAGTSHKVGRNEFLKLPRQTVKAKGHDGVAEFQGAPLVELLESIGVKFGSGLRGKHAPTVAICEAADGYRVVITLLEIDPATTDRLAIVADQRDGKPLDAHTGFYRMVIPDDKHEIRWIRNLQSIRVVNLRDFPLQAPHGKGDEERRP